MIKEALNKEEEKKERVGELKKIPQYEKAKS
jgi:hypothetical protein